MQVTKDSVMNPQRFERCPTTKSWGDQILTPEVLEDKDRQGRWIDMSVMLERSCYAEIQRGQKFPPFLQEK